MWLGNLAKRNQDNPTTLWQIIWKIVKTRDAFEQSKKQNFPQGCDKLRDYCTELEPTRNLSTDPRYMRFPCKVHQRSFVLFIEKKSFKLEYNVQWYRALGWLFFCHPSALGWLFSCHPPFWKVKDSSQCDKDLTHYCLWYKISFPNHNRIVKADKLY